MINNFYKQIMNISPIGYAYIKIICDSDGVPADFEYIEFNPAYEKLSGIKTSDPIYEKKLEIFTDLENRSIDLISIYNEISVNQGAKEFIVKFSPTANICKAHLSSPENNNMVLFISDITDEKLALEENKAIITTLNDIVFELSEDFVFYNIHVADDNFLLLTRDQIIGKSIKDLFSDQLSQLFISMLTKSRNTGKRESIIYSLPSLGENRWFKAEASYLTINDQNRFLTRITEISDQKAIQDSLDIKTEQLESFFVVNLDLLCITDTDGHFIRVNREWEYTLGYPAQYLEGKLFLSFVHPDDLEATVNELSKLKKHEKVLNFVNRFRTKDGSYRYIEWRSNLHGNQIYVAARDISDRINNEKVLRNQKEQFELCVRGSKGGIWDWQLNTNTLFLSAEWKSQLGYDDDEIPNEFISFMNLIHPEDKVTALKKINQYFKGELSVYDNIFRMLHKNGDYRFIRDRGEALRDKNGKVYRMAGSHTDITELKEAEDIIKKSEEMYRLLAENSSDVIWIYNINANKLSYVTPSIFQLRGLTVDEAMSENMEKALTQESFKLVKEQISLRMSDFLDNPSEQKNYINEVQQPCKNGEIIWVEFSSRYRFNENNEVEIVGVSRNIENRKRIEKELQESNELLNNLLDVLPIAVYYKDLAGNYIGVNNAYGEFSGHDTKTLKGKNIFDVIPSQIASVYHQKDIELLKKTGKQIFETQLTDSKGINHDVVFHKATFTGIDGKLKGLIGAIIDVTERNFLEKELRKLANTDELTGLMNRRHFIERAEQEISRLCRYGGKCSLFMLDIDHFKNVNDTYGHQSGDAVLQQFAMILKDTLRENDLICRLGGEEFVVLLLEIDDQIAIQAAERLRSNIFNTVFYADDEQELKISASIGISSLNKDIQTITSLMKSADEALYKAKAAGRNRVV